MLMLERKDCLVLFSVSFFCSQVLAFSAWLVLFRGSFFCSNLAFC